MIILKWLLLILISVIYLPAFFIVTLLGDLWKDLLEEFGL
jgi:hypothetical protein